MVSETFFYEKNLLCCEGVSLKTIAAEVGTPVYVYSKARILNQIRKLQASLEDLNIDIYFSVKACSNIFILDLFRLLGCGADIVSGGELFRTAAAKFSPESIVFSGVGKTSKEIEEALLSEIAYFNVESKEELLEIDSAAHHLGKTPKIALRVNPNIDPKTHPYISTGLRKNKFGLSATELSEIYSDKSKLKAAKLSGLSCHIGSQITSKKPFEAAWKALLETAQKAPFEVKHLNLGGGLGICYKNENTVSLEEYGRLIYKTFKNTPYHLGIEPGRSLIADAGVLVSSVTFVKNRGEKVFYIMDAGMNDLIRPALYQSTHWAFPVGLEQKRQRKVRVDLVGPICETADTFEQNATITQQKKGNLLAFTNAGAYGMSMASQYNSRPRPAEVLVDGNQYHVIRSRETYADLIERELI